MPERPFRLLNAGVGFRKSVPSGNQWEELEMRHPGVAIAAGVVFAGASASAQQPELNDTQKLGQSLFVQSCGVCHLKPQLNSAQFGPTLSRESASGNENAMRQVIANGTPRMPGFKFTFTEQQI